MVFIDSSQGGLKVFLGLFVCVSVVLFMAAFLHIFSKVFLSDPDNILDKLRTKEQSQIQNLIEDKQYLNKTWHKTQRKDHYSDDNLLYVKFY